MYQQGFCSAFCLENAKLLQHHNACDPCCQRCPVDYPSPCCYSVPNFNKHTFPKEKYDSCGVPPLRKKLKKRRKCKSTARCANSDFMLNLCKEIPHGKNKCCCCKKPSNCADHKDDGCEPVEETCTQFMEIVQNAVQETVKDCAKATMHDIYKKICCKIDEMSCQTTDIHQKLSATMEEMSCKTKDIHNKLSCKMDEISCQMQEVKDVVVKVATKNDLRFKCICEFLFTNLKTPVELKEEDDNQVEVDEDDVFENICKDEEKVEMPSICFCPHCVAKRERNRRRLEPKKSVTSQKSNLSTYKMKSIQKCQPPRMSTCSSQFDNKYTISTVPSCRIESSCSMQRSQFQEVDCVPPVPSCDDKEPKVPKCLCVICKCNYNLRDPQKANPSGCCCCDKPRSSSCTGPPVPPRRRGGTNRSCFKKRWSARDYKPSPERAHILSTHCSRIDTMSKRSSVGTKSSFPDIIIDQNELNACKTPNSSTDEVDSQEKCDNSEKTRNSNVHFHKRNENYMDFSLRYEAPDFRHMRSNL